MSEEKSSIPTVLRGYAILEKVVEAPRPISAAELINEIGLPKPTVHRLLQQLEDERLIQREPSLKRYIPGFRAQTLAFGVASNRAFGAPRHAILQELSDEIGETCNCTMLEEDHIIYFDRVEANWPFNIHLPIGTRLPLHCTASGKLFLAYMDPKQRDRLITAAPLQRNSEKTITDPKLLEQDLLRIKKEGISFDDEENLAGLVSIAVPVFDNKNEICFTVAVHAPKIRKPLNELRQYVPSLKRAAAAMRAIFFDGQ